MRAAAATAFRLEPDLHAALLKAATDRGLSMNYIVNAALRDFLPRLIPADELLIARTTLVKDNGAAP
jgi:predicted transcriptional regulator